MAWHIAIQMDPIDRVKVAGDSTIALAEEANIRGHHLYYYTPDTLSLTADGPTAWIAPLSLNMGNTPFYQLGEATPRSLREMDIILVRNDPPFNMDYISATYMLETIADQVLIANHPRALRDLVEKLIPLQFPDYIPATLVTRHLADIEAFQKAHGSIVIKPLYGYGGNAVFLIPADGTNLAALVETLSGHAAEPLVVQAFLPEVSTEEKRIITIDGNVEGVIGRIPSSGDIRSNFRVGGSAKVVELTPTQTHIAETVAAWLAERGILLAGLDMIGDYFIEANITSPTALRQITHHTSARPAQAFWDAVEKKL